MKFKMLASLSVALLAGAGVAANWTYDTSAKTITDGNWTLKVFAHSNGISIPTTSASFPIGLSWTKFASRWDFPRCH